MAAPKEVIELIERFTQHLDDYRNGRYTETQLRRDYLDPFFRALGWDIDNSQGLAEAYRDVIHEDAVKIGGYTKAPDYSFRVGGTRKFFVEAKKPSVDIKSDLAPAFQLRRYAWSAKLPLSILTDFEEFSIYDCRVRPVKTDKPATARIHYWTFADYAEKWEEIAAIFSKEAVLKGSFDKFADTNKGKRGTAEVDNAFLDEIERWRESLAKNIALRNPELSQRALNHSVQQTIDRIIFLRICEDRGIEPYGQLQALQNGANVYKRLVEHLHKADERYNSGLFHFHKEQDRAEEPDRLTLGLDIDDKPLKDIFQNLYYPDSPYEFSVLGADILGSVYEQFLGKVIRLTDGHHAKIEEKPEVKKAGGVYYTPTYIVDYIVKHTVGKLLEGKTPKQVEKLRILDPACGSGSFLIGAYQYLLDWHRDWYEKDGAEKHAKGKSPKLYQGARSEWKLTTGERRRVLLNNIFGVDIDAQAVEVTKLSLLLKVLEQQSVASLTQNWSLLHERALPDLGRNIKCGNSLVGPEFYESQLIPLSDEERSRINTFDWRDEFREIMQSGGFDAVIGNPPYIRIQVMKEWAPHEVEYYKTQYLAASKGNYDIYVVFVEKGLSLLNKSGRLGFILPHKFFNAQYGEPLRLLISQGKNLAEIVHFSDQQIFDGATTYTCLLFLDKIAHATFGITSVSDLDAWRRDGAAMEGTVDAAQLTTSEWNFSVGTGNDLFKKLKAMPVKLGDIAAKIAQGIRTSANEVYVLDVVSADGARYRARSKQLNAEVELEKTSVSPFLQGREIKSYRVVPSGKTVIIPYVLNAGGATLIPEKEYAKRFPKTHAYLVRNKDYLQSREKGKMRGEGWYAYSRLQNIEVMRSPKILVPDIADRASFAFDEMGEYAFTSGYGIILKPNAGISEKYLLGLLNSRLLDFFLKRVSTTLRGGFFRYFTQFVEQLPIRMLDCTKPDQRSQHDRMVVLVESMLVLYKQLAAATTPHEQESFKRQIDVTDRQIDKFAYELYGLTDEEVRIVEGSAN